MALGNHHRSERETSGAWGSLAERHLSKPSPKIHEMAGRRKYTEIAEGLNSAGLRTAFGRRFTSQHVAYICRRDGLSRYRKRARRGSQERRKQTDTEKS